MNQSALTQAHQYFTCLTELRRDAGLIGQVLSNYEEWLIKEADRRAEWSAEHQREIYCRKIRELLDKLHDLSGTKLTASKKPRVDELGKLASDASLLLPDSLPDSWQVLLDLPAVSATDRSIFRAAQSQLKALRHLGRIARGEATLNADWNVKLQNAETINEIEHALKKLGAALAKYDLFHAEAQNNPNREYREWASRLIEESRRERTKRGEGLEAKQAKPIPRFVVFRKTDRLKCALVEWWVRGPCAAPGLMFFRNEARTEFLRGMAATIKSHSEASVKKTCQLLKLISVGTRNHIVWNYSIRASVKDGKASAKSGGRQRNGECVFMGELQPSNRGLLVFAH